MARIGDREKRERAAQEYSWRTVSCPSARNARIDFMVKPGLKTWGGDNNCFRVLYITRNYVPPTCRLRN